jgi:hypothetical protein
MEEAITGDFALVKAWKADRAGNLVFRYKADLLRRLYISCYKLNVWKEIKWAILIVILNFKSKQNNLSIQRLRNSFRLKDNR